MRICLHTTPSTSIVPFDYQQKLVGALHKWLGENDIHNQMSLYSCSWLFGGKMIKGRGLCFPEGAHFFVSFFDDDYMRILIKTILSRPEMFSGLIVKEIQIVSPPHLIESPQTFRLASPVFIKRFEENTGNMKFYLFDDEICGKLMTETLKNKMKIAGLPEDDMLRVEFDMNYPRKQVKMVTIHGVKNKASLCPVIIHGSPQSKLFAWLVGIGNSTGSSFGALL